MAANPRARDSIMTPDGIRPIKVGDLPAVREGVRAVVDGGVAEVGEPFDVAGISRDELEPIPDGFHTETVGVVLLVRDGTDVRALYDVRFWRAMLDGSDMVNATLDICPSSRENLDAISEISVRASAALFKRFRAAPSVPTIQVTPPTPVISADGRYLVGQEELLEEWSAWCDEYPDSPHAAKFRERLARGLVD